MPRVPPVTNTTRPVILGRSRSLGHSSLCGGTTRGGVIAAVVLGAVVLISGPFSFLITLLLGRGDLSFERGDHGGSCSMRGRRGAVPRRRHAGAGARSLRRGSRASAVRRVRKSVHPNA